MSSILAKLLKEDDDSMKTILKDGGIQINNMFDELCNNFEQFVLTGDKSFLKNELERTREGKATVSTESRNMRKKVLSEISENSEISDKIKLERISTVSTASVESGVSIDSNVKQQLDANLDDEDMPAPTKLPPRKRKIKKEPLETSKRTTRTLKPTEKEELSCEQKISSGKPSDILIQDTTISVIDISSEPEEKETNKENTRSTRTKTRQKAQAAANLANVQIKVEPQETKPVRSTRTRNKKQNPPADSENNAPSEAEIKLPPTSKVDKEDANVNKTQVGPSKTPQIDPIKDPQIDPNKDRQTDPNKTGQTEYEDALSSPDPPNINATYVKNDDKHENKNDVEAKQETVNVSEKKVSNSKIPKKHNNTPKPLSKKTKEIFSPYEKSSTKKKVEAYEKLTNHCEASPPSKCKRVVDSENKNSKREVSATRTKIGTPAHYKFTPKVCSTSKIDRMLPRTDTSMNTDGVLSSKSHSALKASRDEFREREKRRQEKEREALKKREALLEGLSEQKRKKREEKHLKAQIQREQLEKENLKKMEAQKIREERYKQLMAEKEEKIQRQKLESEKKRLLVKKKAEELKEKEKEEPKLNETATIETIDPAKLALLKKQREQDDQQPPRPIYMVTRAPLLPTADCYDSDESCGDKPRTFASWTKDRELNKMQYAIIYAGEKIKNTFFSRQTYSPDLVEIFENIDPRKLERTSSAVWRKPPRYTLFAETSRIQFSEDED